MGNLLNQEIDYKIDETASGVWRSYLYPDGQLFREYRSNLEIYGMPFIHYTSGRCPETGRRKIARGFIAVGRISVGVIAIGHAAFGLVALGQLAVGLLFFMGQLGGGLAGIGQVALALAFGLGQVATGFVAIGQVAIGYYALGQMGIGMHVWSVKGGDPEAVRFFRQMLRMVTGR